jgi:threonine dehydrogenase-like Zn-dependent dehydrogenase
MVWIYSPGMFSHWLIVVVSAMMTSTLLAAEQRSGSRRTTNEVKCAADLGVGVKTKRQFCDVVIASSGDASVSMVIPPHTGTATLLFDLHNRFLVPIVTLDPSLAFTRHLAVIAVIGPTGGTIEQVAVMREFRTTEDLFDSIGGGGRPGGIKAVAPSDPEAVRVTIPAGVNAVGIIGVRLDVTTRTTSKDSFDTPGRAIAIVSNLRIQYTAR